MSQNNNIRAYENNKMCKGGIYFSRIDFVRKKHGIDGMTRILEKMKSSGYNGPMDEKSIKIAKWYPMDYNISFLKTYKELYGEKNLMRMAREAPKKKGFVGLFLKWAGTPEMLIKKSGEYWSSLYNFGRLEGIVTGEGEAVIKGYDVSPDPIFCEFLTGYFIGVIEQTGVSNITSEHTICSYKGGEHEEWILRWGKSNKADKKESKEISWSKSLESGIDEIDHQHMEFVRILNRINKDVGTASVASLRKTLNFMDYYAHWHFGTEEKYMKKYKYPYTQSHMLQHRKFYEYTQEMIQKSRYGVDEELALSVKTYLIDWLILHIQNTDMKFARFLKENNLVMEKEEMPEDIENALKDMNLLIKEL